MTQTLFDIICERRGWTPETMAQINRTDHTRLLDMDKMVDLLHQINQSQELIVVLPDFDMDGITSGTLGFAGLCELGFNAALYRPDAQRGHGFSAYDIEKIIEMFPEASAIISCDTGIDSYEGIDHARRRGLTVLITDHHKQIQREDTDENLLPANAVVDPSRVDDGYELKGICGAHVLYQVLRAYTAEHAPHKMEDISLLRLFAGIGTVSDVMPVVQENRRMVSDSVAIAKLLYVQPEVDEEGARLMPDVSNSMLMILLNARPHHPAFVAAFDGIARVIAHFAVQGKLRSVDDLDEGFYGFYLAPAFNAVRRMQGSMEDAFGSFFYPDKDERIALIIQMNEQRKVLVQEYTRKLLTEDQPWAPYIYTTDAPGGMLGLLANQMMSHSGLPTLVLHDHGRDDETISGSGRAPTWFPFNSVLNQAGYWAAGHEQAFGVRISQRSDLDTLAEFIETQTKTAIEDLAASGEDIQSRAVDLRLGPTPECDANYDDVEELLELARRIQLLKPFGHTFREPEIEIVADLAECHVDAIGSEGQHVRISLPSGVRCLLWNAEDLLLDLKEATESPVDSERRLRMTTHISINNFMGNISPNFMIVSGTAPMIGVD